MSARSEALVMAETDAASERERRKAEAREAQALLDSLEPGSDQAARLIESASRKGIKLRVRHTLVDRTAIEALADGLRRDYEEHQAGLAEQRRKKLLRVGVALGVAMIVAAAVVVLSGLYMRPSPAPEAGAAAAGDAARGEAAGARAEGPAEVVTQPVGAGRQGDGAPQPSQGAAQPARELCPAPSEPKPAPPPVVPATKTAEPASPADASPRPAPSNKIEPYFGATP